MPGAFTGLSVHTVVGPASSWETETDNQQMNRKGRFKPWWLYGTGKTKSWRGKQALDRSAERSAIGSVDAWTWPWMRRKNWSWEDPGGRPHPQKKRSSPICEKKRPRPRSRAGSREGASSQGRRGGRQSRKRVGPQRSCEESCEESGLRSRRNEKSPGSVSRGGE